MRIRTRTVFLFVTVVIAGTAMLAAHVHNARFDLSSSQQPQDLSKQFQPSPEQPSTVSQNHPTPTRVPNYRATWPDSFSPLNRWLIYRSRTLKLSFKYPPELTIGDVPTANGTAIIGVGLYSVTADGARGPFPIEDVVSLSKATGANLSDYPKARQQLEKVTSTGLIEHEYVLANPPPKVFYAIDCYRETVAVGETISVRFTDQERQQVAYYNMLQSLVNSITCGD